jgi:hypothetical protein
VKASRFRPQRPSNAEPLSGGFPVWTTAYLIGTAGGGAAAVVPPGEWFDI